MARLLVYCKPLLEVVYEIATFSRSVFPRNYEKTFRYNWLLEELEDLRKDVHSLVTLKLEKVEKLMSALSKNFPKK